MNAMSTAKRSMIDTLISHAMTAVSDDPEGTWLRLILRRGFTGFENMSEQQLRTELQLRGLADFEVQEEVDADEELDDAGTEVEWRRDFGTMAVASDLDSY